MPHHLSKSILAAIPFAFALVLAHAPSEVLARAADPRPATIPMQLTVDTSEVERGYVHVSERIAVTPGALTLVYPKWIPGEHAPSGPIANVAGLEIHAGSQRLAWVRDLVDLYAYRVVVPAGITALDVRFDYLAANAGNYSSARLATPNMLTITWNKFVIYPLVDDVATIDVTPKLVLPGSDWQYGTALAATGRSGATVAFAPVTLNKLVDSPLDAGINKRSWPLGSIADAPIELDVFADTPEELEATPERVEGYRRLVTQMGALYGARHFDRYTFLLTLSDEMPGNGVEHHQSSDDGTGGDFFTDPKSFVTDATLLTHEFNHSWDGKYRRPADLATTNFQVPMIDDLLWVYEGMTQHYGELQSERAGLWTKQQWLDSLAGTWAQLDSTTGRLTRSLVDTATSGPFLYAAPRELSSARRRVDFYPEGEMMWILADETIRAQTHGAKTLDDFTRTFFGAPSSGPITKTYTRGDVVAALDALAPNDWNAFFTKWIDGIAPHPPDIFERGGYRLVYAAKPTDFYKTANAQRHTLDARYSLGIIARSDGTIGDVIEGSVANKAGIGVGVKIAAIDGRALSAEGSQRQLDDALVAHERTTVPIHLLLLGGGIYRDVAFAYRGGPRYPRLERMPGTPDVLSDIAKPLAP